MHMKCVNCSSWEYLANIEFELVCLELLQIHICPVLN